jgi:hypothetical protein
MNDKFTIVIPYSEVVHGEIIMVVGPDYDVTRDEFIKGVQTGKIDPFAFVVGDEEWTADNSNEQDISYREVRIERDDY